MTPDDRERIVKTCRRALAVTRRQAQERRAKEWEAYVAGGPCPPLSDAEVTKLMRDIMGPKWQGPK